MPEVEALDVNFLFMSFLRLRKKDERSLAFESLPFRQTPPITAQNDLLSL